jgi:hypothetical protein
VRKWRKGQKGYKGRKGQKGYNGRKGQKGYNGRKDRKDIKGGKGGKGQEKRGRERRMEMSKQKFLIEGKNVLLKNLGGGLKGIGTIPFFLGTTKSGRWNRIVANKLK